MDFLLNIRIFKEEKLGQGERWELIVRKPLVVLRRSFPGICSQFLEVLGEL